MFLICLGCGKKEVEKSNFNISKNLDYPVVFIPNAGCPGCISQAEEFLISYKGSDLVQFVLCRVVSQKELKIKLGSDILNYSNITLDTVDVLSKLQVSGFYPVIAYSKDSLVEVSPSFPTSISDLIMFLEGTD